MTTSKTLNPGKNVILYTTTKTITNPIGDGRHNRAPWRSSLHKNSIPAGFVFGVAEDGSIEDRSRPFEVIGAEEAQALRDALLSVAGEPMKAVEPEVEETVEDVLAALPTNVNPTAEIIRALGIPPKQLRAMLLGSRGQEQAQSSSEDSASSQARAH